jgi:hypothetical protein
MRPARTNIDTYDPHEPEWVHDVIHPPQCRQVDRGGYLDYDCVITFCTDGIGSDVWVDATGEGVRIVGWRHDVYPVPWAGTEHDVVCWALPEPISSRLEDVRPT